MMRRSSGMGGGARMFRAMGRAVSASVKEKIPAKGAASRTARVVNVTSPPSSSVTSSPLSKGSVSYFFEDEDDGEWENVFVGGDGSGFGFDDRRIFGPVPTKEEAEEAVSTIQQIFVPVTFSQVLEAEMPYFVDESVGDRVIVRTDSMQRDFSSESESDWMEPAMHLYSSKSYESIQREKVLDAFRLLQINQPFKRMVMSLSSDQAVWDAVMKNDVVQELKKSFYEAENGEPPIKDEERDIPKGILNWIMRTTKGKIMDFFDKISKLACEVFQSQEKDKDKAGDPFDDLLRSSFMLSVVVFIIVVATRIQRA